MSDLIERLRGPCPSIPAMRDAASEIERLTAARDELRRQLAEAELDAQRYRWLRPRFFAADFAYSDPPVCAIVFRWPESAKISANLDREIDAAWTSSWNSVSCNWWRGPIRSAIRLSSASH